MGSLGEMHQCRTITGYLVSGLPQNNNGGRGLFLTRGQMEIRIVNVTILDLNIFLHSYTFF